MNTKVRLLIFLLSCVIASTSACFSQRVARQKLNDTAARNSSNESQQDDSAFAAREEVQKSFTLVPDSEISIVDLSGSVEVKSSDSQNVTLHVLRLAPRKEEFENRILKIEQEENELYIDGDYRDGNDGIWGEFTGHSEIRTRVTISVPRKISLRIASINGRINVGDIEGQLKVQSINGNVKIAQIGGSLQLRSINGEVETGIAAINQDGIEINHLNGNATLTLLSDLNATVEARYLNGRISAELPNYKVEHEKDNNYRALIGNGGAEIMIRNSNGNIRFIRGVIAGAKK